MTKYSTFTFEIETELLAWLKEESKRSGRTKDEIVEQAIRQYLDAYDQCGELPDDQKD